MPASDPRIPTSVLHLRTLEEVVGWATAHDPPGQIVNVVAQDEYTHDVIVRAGALVLVFDTT